MHYFNVSCSSPVVGDTFEYRGKVFEVCEAEDEFHPCNGCYFCDLDFCPPCRCTFKVFKEVEKKRED